MDWFSEWPEDALESVALDNFRKESIIIDDDTIVKVVSACKYIHKRVEKESKVFSERMRRFVYLTPTSYIELLSLYRKILNMKEMEISEKKKRLLKGLEVLRGAGVEVDKMNQEITKQKPELEKAKKETAILAADLKIKAAAAEEVKAAAVIKEEAAKKFDAECEVILKQSKEELDKVMPLVEKAKNSINKISPDDLRTQTSYNKLNSGCKVLFAALLYFLKGNEWKLKQYEVKDSNPKEYNIKEAVSYINFSKYDKLLETLRNFCSNELLNSLTEEPMISHINLMDQHFKDTGASKASIEHSAGSLVGLYEYLTTLSEFADNKIKKIDPIQKLFKKASEEKDLANKEMEEAVAKKMESEAIVTELRTKEEEETRKMQELDKKVKDATLKMKRASQLIELLSGEQDRWTKDVELYSQQISNLAGDALIAASSICYNGPFIYSYRVDLENDWRKKVEELQIIHTEGITMKKLLENPNEVNEWKIYGLPNDNLSIENGIILHSSRRWPLMVDPQNQGSNYIKKFGKRKEALVVVKGSDANAFTLIKNAIRLNKPDKPKWVLLENVGINLDPTLEPILTQQGRNKSAKDKSAASDDD